jgi:hypothetical protein
MDGTRFFPGSPWTVNHFRGILEFCRIDAALPDAASLSHCDGDCGNITLLAVDDKHYLFYEQW